MEEWRGLQDGRFSLSPVRGDVLVSRMCDLCRASSDCEAGSSPHSFQSSDTCGRCVLLGYRSSAVRRRIAERRLFLTVRTVRSRSLHRRPQPHQQAPERHHLPSVCHAASGSGGSSVHVLQDTRTCSRLRVV